MVVLLIVGLLSIPVSVYGFRKAFDYYSNSDGWILVAILGALVAFMGLLAPTITWSGRAVGRTTCRHFAEQSGYQTKFTILNWADSGTCLALASNGRWVPNTQLIINVPSK